MKFLALAAALMPSVAVAQMADRPPGTPLTEPTAQQSANPADDVRTTGSAAAAQMKRENAGTIGGPTGSAATSPAQSPMAAGASPTVSAGQQVTDTSGAPVGRIESVEGDFVVLATSSAKVRVPRTSFAERNGVLVIAMTEAQVNAAAGSQPPSR